MLVFLWHFCHNPAYIDFEPMRVLYIPVHVEFYRLRESMLVTLEVRIDSTNPMRWRKCRELALDHAVYVTEQDLMV